MKTRYKLTLQLTLYFFVFFNSCSLPESGHNDRMSLEEVSETLYRYWWPKDRNWMVLKRNRELRNGANYHPELRRIIEDTNENPRVRQGALMTLSLSDTVTNDFKEAMLFALKEDRLNIPDGKLHSLELIDNTNFNSSDIGDELVKYFNEEKKYYIKKAIIGLTHNGMVERIPDSLLINSLKNQYGIMARKNTIKAIGALDSLNSEYESILRDITNSERSSETIKNMAKEILSKFELED